MFMLCVAGLYIYQQYKEMQIPHFYCFIRDGQRYKFGMRTSDFLYFLIGLYLGNKYLM